MSASAFYWAALGSAYLLIAALFTAMLLHFRASRDQLTKLSEQMAGVIAAAEIYKDTQRDLLDTIRSITSQNADIYRDLTGRFATLEERSNNHGQELRRIAKNHHDLRAECRTAIYTSVESLRADIARIKVEP